jgi:hypothetical protein
MMTPDMVRGRRLSVRCMHREWLVVRPVALVPARWPWGEGPLPGRPGLVVKRAAWERAPIGETEAEYRWGNSGLTPA